MLRLTYVLQSEKVKGREQINMVIKERQIFLKSQNLFHNYYHEVVTQKIFVLSLSDALTAANDFLKFAISFLYRRVIIIASSYLNPLAPKKLAAGNIISKEKKNVLVDKAGFPRAEVGPSLIYTDFAAWRGACMHLIIWRSIQSLPAGRCIKTSL